jgi:hypothetical protein
MNGWREPSGQPADGLLPPHNATVAAAQVRVSHVDGSLVFSATDNGRGFDSGTTAKGSGLQNMSDRLAALGGELEVLSSPGGGTRISGRLPVPALNLPDRVWTPPTPNKRGGVRCRLTP